MVTRNGMRRCCSWWVDWITMSLSCTSVRTSWSRWTPMWRTATTISWVSCLASMRRWCGCSSGGILWCHCTYIRMLLLIISSYSWSGATASSPSISHPTLPTLPIMASYSYPICTSTQLPTWAHYFKHSPKTSASSCCCRPSSLRSPTFSIEGTWSTSSNSTIGISWRKTYVWALSSICMSLLRILTTRPSPSTICLRNV